MKYSNIQAFEKHLQGSSPAHFARVYVVICKDRFERKQAVELLTTYLRADKNRSGVKAKTFESVNAHIEELLTELNSFSFFSDHQLLHLLQAERLTTEQTKQFEPYFSNPNPRCTLIISAESLNSSTNFYKNAEKAGIILDIPEEKPWEKERRLQDWVMQTVSQAGKKVSAQTSQLLVKSIGPDAAALHQEIQKLICYCGSRIEITGHDIQAVCSSINQETIWQLGEAIFRRDAATALRIADPLLQDRGEFIPFIRQLRSQFQTEYQICCILANGGGSAQVAAEYPYMKGAILERHLQQAQSYGIERCRKGLLLIDEAELNIKSGVEDYMMLKELLIAKLAI